MRILLLELKISYNKNCHIFYVFFFVIILILCDHIVCRICYED